MVFSREESERLMMEPGELYNISVLVKKHKMDNKNAVSIVGFEDNIFFDNYNEHADVVELAGRYLVELANAMRHGYQIVSIPSDK